MPKAVDHVVRRPGRKPGDPEVEIPVAEDLTSVPGIPLREVDVTFYSRADPLESQEVEKSADREWAGATAHTPEMVELRRRHADTTEQLVKAAAVSGGLEPTGAPELGKDVTQDIADKARELGYGEVGFTKFDRRYVYVSKRSWAKYPHAICLALEQDLDPTQSAPSMEQESAHYDVYERGVAVDVELAAYIRTLGYHAQIHSGNDDTVVFIPMFVNAGLGQLGANGQLLSPHFGSRARLAIITTDARVTYDKPIDYGINEFCQVCQVCVDRCPGRALVRDKVWWRGAKKNKAIYERCFPIYSRYEGCAVCVKVCPVQRYGMKPVMEHYVETGQVLGKGTHNLEGYTLRDKGYFGPGELPKFRPELFDVPRGRKEDWLFHEFKRKLVDEGIPSEEALGSFANDVKSALQNGHPPVEPR